MKLHGRIFITTTFLFKTQINECTDPNALYHLVSAGVIYLKNMVMQFWEDREAAHPTDPVPFGIHEQDRQAIRDNIIEAVIGAPEPVRYINVGLQLPLTANVLIENELM